MPIKAGHLLLAGGGGVFLWSGIKGKSISSVFRQLAGGDAPSGASSANPITGVSPLTTAQADANTSDLSSGSDMQNLMELAEFLVRNGFSDAAAAGVCGTVFGESGGNPESVGSGGAGLIGWTPASSMVQYGGTCKAAGIGNNSPSVDFQNQAQALLSYANANSSDAVNRGGVDLATLKTATSPTQAGTWWSAFEGPLNPGSDVRNSVATQIFNELQNGGSSNVPTG
jgi:Phage tail lysozyme